MDERRAHSQRYRQTVSPSRRAAVATLALLPFSAWLSGCAGSRVDSRAQLRNAYDDLRGFLNEHAADSAQAEHWNAIADDVEAHTRAMLEEVAGFEADFDAGLEDPEATATALAGQVDAHMERRRSLRRAILNDQERLKRAVGQARWDELATILNRGATKLLDKTRAA